MSSFQKSAFIIAAVYGMIAVIFAALGSHLFHIDKASVNYVLFNNSVIYQLIHSILVLWLSTLKNPNFWIRSAIIAMLTGITLFCLGLYIFTIYGKTNLSFITPIGGSLIILGWLNLTISGFKKYFDPPGL